MNNNSNIIKILDTTLRDGEQSPGCSMNLEEKVNIAKALEALGVDIIEVGFPASSQGDFQACQQISKNITKSKICVLARANFDDIKTASNSIINAKSKRIHIFIATSDIHLNHKLHLTQQEVIEKIKQAVTYGKSLCDDIEFSAEDASRTSKEFLLSCLQAAVDCGASTINIPDTVGYSTPEEMYDYIKYIKENIKSKDHIDISVHCHNDLGMAVANSLAAINAGATQVECTINGLGERAGNAALEEIAMCLNTRGEYYKKKTNIVLKNIYKTSKLVEAISGIQIQVNKAIVGSNAFKHESGIHQHGVINSRETYEIINPEIIGIKNDMVMGKHSGRHAFNQRVLELGYDLTPDELDEIFKEFKTLTDKKKTVSDKDILALLSNKFIPQKETYSFLRFVINSGNTITSTAMIKVEYKNKEIEKVATGSGPIDAAFKVLNKICNMNIELLDYHIRAMTQGEDALGEAVVKLLYKGNVVVGRAISTDIVEASIKAYIAGINKASLS